MKNRIIKKIFGFIWSKLLSVNWKTILFSFWVSYIKPFLKKLVEKSDNKFDDAMLNGLDKLVQTFLAPSNEFMQMDEEKRGEAVKDFFKKIWEWIKSKLVEMDWQAFIYKLWENYFRDALKNLVKRSDNKFDDAMYEAIKKIIDTFFKPKETLPPVTENK